MRPDKQEWRGQGIIICQGSLVVFVRHRGISLWVHANANLWTVDHASEKKNNGYQVSHLDTKVIDQTNRHILNELNGFVSSDNECSNKGPHRKQTIITDPIMDSTVTTKLVYIITYNKNENEDCINAKIMSRLWSNCLKQKLIQH